MVYRGKPSAACAECRKRRSRVSCTGDLYPTPCRAYSSYSRVFLRLLSRRKRDSYVADYMLRISVKKLTTSSATKQFPRVDNVSRLAVSVLAIEIL